MARRFASAPVKRRASPPPLLPFDSAGSSYRTRSGRTPYSFQLRLRRLFRTPWPRIFLALLALLQILDIVRIHVHLSVEHDSADVIELARRHHGERIYIASMHWNDGPIVRNHWNPAVVHLAEVLGPKNIFVSVYESGSWDDTKAALTELDVKLEQMGVPRNITRSNITHKDEMAEVGNGEGWIATPRDRHEMRRIPFLARLRNRTLRDLEELHKAGIYFDKILFLNDVVFSVSSLSIWLFCFITLTILLGRGRASSPRHKPRILCCRLLARL